MSLVGAIWDTASALIVWARAKADEVSGKGQVEVSGDDRPDVEHCALPGFYSGISDDDELLLLRRDDGGVTVAARTERPTGCEAGDRGVLTPLVHLRLRDGKVEVMGVPAGAPLRVMLDGDMVQPTVSMATWITKAQEVLVGHDPTIVAPVDFGTCVASGGTLLWSE